VLKILIIILRLTHRKQDGYDMDNDFFVSYLLNKYLSCICIYIFWIFVMWVFTLFFNINEYS